MLRLDKGRRACIQRDLIDGRRTVIHLAPFPGVLASSSAATLAVAVPCIKLVCFAGSFGTLSLRCRRWRCRCRCRRGLVFSLHQFENRYQAAPIFSFPLALLEVTQDKADERGPLFVICLPSGSGRPVPCVVSVSASREEVNSLCPCSLVASFCSWSILFFTIASESYTAC